MLISCPECDTSFSVPAKAIGDNGKKVRCSKCTNVWFQSPVLVDETSLDRLLESRKSQNNKELSSQPQSSVNLPARVVKWPLYAGITSLVALVLLNLAIFYFSNIKQTENYEGLKFSDFSFESEVIDNKYDLFLKGKIFNVSDRDIKTPEILISLYSKGGRIMAESTIKPLADEIKARSFIDFAPEITQISGNTHKVELKINNWIEAALER